MKNVLIGSMTGLLLLGAGGIGNAAVFTDDFSGDLSNWTAGPSHLDSYGIIGGELFLNGKGHLNGGAGGWGVLQLNRTLGSNFSVEWDARITFYDYASFILSVDPWVFNPSSGYTPNGYIGWIDINDPVTPLFDMGKITNTTFQSLAQNISYTPDIAQNEWFHWKLEKNGTAIKVTINNTVVADVTDQTFATSNFKFGFSFSEDSEGYFDNVSVTYNPVPLPGAVWLLGSGLAGIIGATRRKKGKI